MRIAYIDLQINNPPEDYSQNAFRYGGAACFARYAKELLNNDKDEFYIFGSDINFGNVSNSERLDRCIALSEQQLSNLRNGGTIEDNLPKAKSFDIFLYHHDCRYLALGNIKAKLVHWDLMSSGTACHRSTPYTLLYRPGAACDYAKSYPIIIGKYVSDTFEPSIRENCIFVCSRHDQHMNSIETAKFCLENKIVGVFAGPILDNYPLMNYIDCNYTYYLGLIREDRKNSYLRSSAASIYPHTWNTAFNLSAVESLAAGTPIIAPKRGCFEYLLIEGVNGYYWDGTNLKECYEKCLKLDQRKIWETAQRFSHKAMVNSFYKAFEQILNEN